MGVKVLMNMTLCHIDLQGNILEVAVPATLNILGWYGSDTKLSQSKCVIV